MSKGDTFENQLLLHIFNNSDIADVGDATGLRGSTTAGSLHVSLHSADVGDAGSAGGSSMRGGGGGSGGGHTATPAIVAGGAGGRLRRLTYL